jgi:predicted permease
VRQLLRRVCYVIRRRSAEAELAEEIEFHRAMKREEIDDRASVAREAGRRATADSDAAAHALALRREFGSDLLARDQARDVWISPWLQGLAQDLRFAARLLVKDRWYAAVAILALALGLGVTNTLVTILNASHRGLPFDAADRLMHVGTRDARGEPRNVSRLDFDDWRASTTMFDGLAAYATSVMNVNDAGRAPERFSGSYISANAFALIGVAPVLGRDFLAEDDRPGAPSVVILSGAVWKNRYGADPRLLGRTILVNAVPAVVIGVMPDGFGFPFKEDLWQPLAQMPGLAAQARDARGLDVFGRLSGGASLAQADADLTAIAARLAAAYPETNIGIRPAIEPFNAHYNGRLTDPMSLALLGAVSFVLLIACANVANLLLARAAQRSREIAIRASLGATRGRLVRQLLVESLLLALLAGVCGLALAQLGVRLFANAVDALPKPYWVQFTMDWRLFAWLAAICAGTGLLFGLAPALHVARTDVNGALKEAGRPAAGGVRARRWTGLFVIAELTLTVVLLGGAGLMTRSFFALYRADLVVDTSRVLTMQLSLPATKYATPEQRAAFYDRLQERLDALPPVAAAAISSNLPFARARERPLELDGRPLPPPPPGSRPASVPTLTIGPRYFDAMGLPLLRGRAFSNTDGTPGHDNAIVNQLFVAKYFPGEDPIGLRIRLPVLDAAAARPAGGASAVAAGGVAHTTAGAAHGGVANATRDAAAANAADTSARWLTIVGVAATMRQRPFRAPDPLVYVPARAEPAASAVLIVRGRYATGAAARAGVALVGSAGAGASAADADSGGTGGSAAVADPATMIPLLREEVRALDPDLPLYGVRPLNRLLALSRWMNEVYGLMFAIFAVTALTLSAVGLYSVTAWSVTQRTQEIGLRMALGAPPARVIWLFARRIALQLAIGLTLGLAGAIALGRLLGGALVLTGPADPPTLAAVTVLLTLVCATACLIPTRRAARLDPVVAFRQE